MLSDAFCLGVQDKHGLGDQLDGSDVRIGTEEDVFELGLLLVGFFDHLFLSRGW